ncbi:TAXI family TRAP transporter solute-binding subunit [Rubrivivax sp. RP6-9]|uniref:TAXI family TRAP transporter solute-binding subunit n=1 Tax=Rubrivivax sp. RP6-9 TaxID=3415750 RepID=UPI003CC54FAA
MSSEVDRPPPPGPPRPLRPASRWRTALVEAGPLASVLVFVMLAALAVGAYRVLDPTPERRLVIATGPDQGAYGEFAQRYLPLLQAHGVQVALRRTQGSRENLALLRDPASGVHAAFVQSGADPAQAQQAAASGGLVSLGSVAVEPLWLFYRSDAARRLLGPQAAPPTRLAQLQGWRIHTGPAGGGSGPLFRQLAEANRLDTTALEAGGQAAVNGVVELVQGRIDALALVSAADAPLVQYLLQTPGVQLFDFAQSEAYARRFPFLKPLVLPRGVVDLATDLPPQDVRMVAATASLVARDDLHPALVQLLVQAARQAHGQAGWFNASGEFPNPTAAELPLSDEAERFYRSGPPLLQRYLPFWLANFIDRMWIVLLPLLAALLPLSRIVPPLVELRVRSRVFRWYANLRAVEQALEHAAPDAAELRRLQAELDRLDTQTEHIGVPLSYTNELYDLRAHIHLVRKRVLARLAGLPDPAGRSGQPAAS